MRLCFLMEKTYAPYTKWFGTAFAGLKSSSGLTPLLREVLVAQEWKEREKYLAKAYEVVARLHNQLGITEPVEAEVSQFYGRPYMVIHGDRFADAIMAKIKDESVKSIKVSIGSVNQFVDSTDILSRPSLTKKLKSVFQ
jgi:hypothetical protein